MEYDIIILGAGPAGMTAGIYASRKGLKAIILEHKAVGGEMFTAHQIENYPGFKSISGPELTKKMEEHAKQYTEIVHEEVQAVAKTKNNKFEVKCAKKTYVGRSLLFTTGAESIRLGIKGEKEFHGRGISYCFTCDGPLFKGKTVAVIGGGNTALCSAKMLADIAEKVYIIHRRDEFRGDAILQKEIEEKGVEKIMCCIPVEIIGDKVVKKLKLQDVKTKKEKTIDVDGVFIHVGSAPASGLAKDLGVAVDESGFIKTDEKQKTNIAGIFAAGDVTGGWPQIIVAAYQGATAANHAYTYVKNEFKK